MPYDFENDPRFSLEGICRQSADELIETIVREAQSAADVPAVIERIIGYMRNRWKQEDWDQYVGEFGKDMLDDEDDFDIGDDAGGI
jgi:hypothetical protein